MQLFLSPTITEGVETNGQSLILKNPINRVRMISFRSCSIPFIHNQFHTGNSNGLTASSFSGVFQSNFTVDCNVNVTPNGAATMNSTLTTISNAFSLADPYGAWTFSWGMINQRVTVTIVGQDQVVFDGKKHAQFAHALGLPQRQCVITPLNPLVGRKIGFGDDLIYVFILTIPELTSGSVQRIEETTGLKNDVFAMYTGTNVYNDDQVTFTPPNVTQYYFAQPLTIKSITPTWYIKYGEIVEKLEFGENEFVLELVVDSVEFAQYRKKVQNLLN